MKNPRTDRDWIKWGEKNPYFGVLSDEKFLNKNLDSNSLKVFYESGKNDVENVMALIRQLNNGKLKKFKRALDFGCGTGRISTHLADHAHSVVGIDVSERILKLARTHTPKSKTKRITYKLNQGLHRLPLQGYDLAHSYIVFQHIPPSKGYEIIDDILQGLSLGGYAALHVTTGYKAAKRKMAVTRLRNSVLPVHYAANLIKSRPVSTPRMRMYTYNLNRVCDLFFTNHVENLVMHPTQHGDYWGVMIVGKKLR